MADMAGDHARRLAHMIDDADMGVRCYPRGTRQIGEPCNLAIVINDERSLEFVEEAGDRAPRELVIDLTTESSGVAMLRSALSTRPWMSADSPVIMCAGTDGAPEISYLIRTREIVEIIEAVRDGLDINGLGQNSDGQVRLDAASGGG